MSGRTSLGELAAVLRRAAAVVVGNTGPAHLAACRDTRARDCPVPGHPCLSDVPAEQVVAAVADLTGGPASRRAPVAAAAGGAR